VADHLFLKRAQYGVEPAPVHVRVLAADGVRELGDLRARTLYVNAVLQTADDREEVRASVVGAEKVCVEGDGLPDVRVVVGEVEGGGHDADDRARLPVERQGLAYDIGVAAEASLPERVADDDHAVAAGPVLLFVEGAPFERRDAERGEESGR